MRKRNPPLQPISFGVSPVAQENRRARTQLRATTDGKCFYCGCPTIHQGKTGSRDWMLLGHQYWFVREHATPTWRGGTGAKENTVPACAGCNRAKGALTLDEFRLECALRAGDLNFRFAFDTPAPVLRDWLVCHSPPFERGFMLRNMPSCKIGYSTRSRRPRAALGSPRIA